MLRHLSALLFLAGTALATVDPTRLADAKALLAQRKLPEAQAVFEQLAAANPGDAEITAALGEIARRQGRLDRAIELLEKATAAAPANAAYFHSLGDAAGEAAQKASIFSQPGLARKCRVAYEKAVELEPANVNHRRSLLQFYRQAPGFIGGGMDKAYAQAEAIRKLDAAAGRLELAGLYAADKKYPEAFALFEEVLKAQPDDYASTYQIGRLAAMSGEQLDRGLAALRHCLELPVPAAPNTPGYAAAHWRIGNILEKKGDITGARAAYERSLKLDPKFQPAADALKKL